MSFSLYVDTNKNPNANKLSWVINYLLLLLHKSLELIGVRCKSWVWWELIGRAVQDQKDGAASTSSCRTGKIPKNNREIIFQNWQNPNKSQRNHSAIIHFCNYFAIFHLCISRPTSSLWCAWQLHAGKIYCPFFAKFSATGLTLLGMYQLGYMGFEIVPRLSIQQTIFSNMNILQLKR